MGGASNPVWVTILVGILGMIGVLGGQLINAWREGRRWKREKDLEAKKEELKRQHENVLDWRDKRIAAYTEVLDHLRKYHTSLTLLHIRTVHHPIWTVPDEAAEENWILYQGQYKAMRKEASQCFYDSSSLILLDLLCTDKVRTSAWRARKIFDEALGEAPEISKPNQNPIVDIELSKLDMALEEVLLAMRKELGTETTLTAIKN